MTNFFKISELSKNTLVGRDIGKRTRLKIMNLLLKHDSLIIDMENSNKFSPSFLDEAIVKLVTELGKEDFRRRLKIVNLNEGMKSLMNTILNRNLKKEEKPTDCDTALKDGMEVFKLFDIIPVMVRCGGSIDLEKEFVAYALYSIFSHSIEERKDKIESILIDNKHSALTIHLNECGKDISYNIDGIPVNVVYSNCK